MIDRQVSLQWPIGANWMSNKPRRDKNKGKAPKRLNLVTLKKSHSLSIRVDHRVTQFEFSLQRDKEAFSSLHQQPCWQVLKAKLFARIFQKISFYKKSFCDNIISFTWCSFLVSLFEKVYWWKLSRTIKKW